MTEDQAAQRITAAIIPFSAGQIAKAVGCSKETAKSWIKGDRCPHLAKAINLARAIPAVREWLMEEIDGGNRSAQAGDISEVMARISALEKMQRGG